MNEMKKNYNEKASVKEGLCVCAYNHFAVRLKYCKPTLLINLRILPGPGRSPREGNGNPLQYSCLENPMDGGAWWATAHRVAKSRTRLSDFTFFIKLLKVSAL